MKLAPVNWWSIFVLYSFQWLVVSGLTNNACKTLPAYKFIRSSRNCYFNPNVLSDVSHMVKRHGYPLEKYKVITKDGYILTLYRIYDSGKSNRPPIVIQHGIGGSAAFWVLHDKDSLAFFLFDKGYDVWLSNIRGTTDSRGHINSTISEADYWNFSFHEMGIYDLPAIINHIAKTTGQKDKIIYIGHSMGTTMSYVYSSLLKEHAESHLKGIISFSPVAYMRHLRGVLKLLAPGAPAVANILRSLGFNALGDRPELTLLLQKICSTAPTISICAVLLALGTGLSINQERVDLLPVVTSYFPAPISINTLLHFSQLINNGGHFRQYDYGPVDNYAFYNSSFPLDYPVEKITLPVFLFIGDRDFIATKEDADILRSKLRSSPKIEEYMFDYAHNDFFLARNFMPMYKTLLNVITKLENV